MSNISQFFTNTASENKKTNRKIFIGPQSVTWSAPPSATEVEVHCWGGGGIGGPSYNPGGYYGLSGGGGGGGYVTHVYPISSGQTLSITVGGQGGTSSVSCPSQTPGSPISATGGSPGTYSGPGAGGVGSYSIAPGVPTARTFAANGGSGGANFNGQSYTTYGHAGGGGAGNINGTGGSGYPYVLYTNCIGGGGGGFTPGTLSPDPSGKYISAGGDGIGAESTINTFTSIEQYQNIGSGSSLGTKWFYVPEISGSGGKIIGGGSLPSSVLATRIGAGSGGAGGNGYPGYVIAAQPGGFLGGGGGGVYYTLPGAPGGIAGGGGGDSSYTSGGVGCVIIYW